MIRPMPAQIGPALIGTWNNAAHIDPGSPDATSIHFGPDGVGGIWYGNWAPQVGALFRWELHADRLSTTTLGSFKWDDDGRWVEVSRGPEVEYPGLALDLTDVAVDVRFEVTHWGQRIPVLRFPPETLDDLFGDEYGFVACEPIGAFEGLVPGPGGREP